MSYTYIVCIIFLNYKLKFAYSDTLLLQDASNGIIIRIYNVYVYHRVSAHIATFCITIIVKQYCNAIVYYYYYYFVFTHMCIFVFQFMLPVNPLQNGTLFL